ncbi:MAG: hypothetical protein KF767_12180 [Bdellovibrionaceae bacterium]|nr:hypothetical protein [Pseudobdellovibrionaceae bacterium]
MHFDVHISSKLSQTILRYIENSGDDTTLLLESVEVPEEFLRDPSYWIKAEELEHLIAVVLERSREVPGQQLLSAMAQSCVESRSWGVLDSVMRMMTSPAEVFSQPERFLSYFIAPAPPVANQERSSSGLAFDLPISSEQYPLVTKFMAASFEAIPVFMGRPAARCEWDGFRLSLNWDAPQRQIFDAEQIDRQLSPELARDLLQNLQSAATAPAVIGANDPRFFAPSVVDSVAKQNIEASVMARTMDRLPLFFSPGMAPFTMRATAPVATPAASADAEALRADYDQLRHHIARLSDYMIRAQQIITLMASAKKISPEVREVMRRVDWPVVQQQFPQTVEQCYRLFRQNRSLPHPQEDHHV